MVMPFKNCSGKKLQICIIRFQRILPFQALNQEQLKIILKDKVLVSYETEFKLDGIELSVDDAVLDFVVNQSLIKETGARGIESALVQHLENAAFEAYSQKCERVTVLLKQGEISFDID